MDHLTNLEVRLEDGVGWIALESETEMNSFNDTLIEELTYCASEFAEDEDVRCMVLRGSDGVFCAGGNISSFDDDPAGAAADLRRGTSNAHDAVVQLARSETPLVTGIDGPAVGAGFSLALAGDISIVHENAFLKYGFPGIGLPGDSSATYFLPRLVGLQEAKRIALLDERIPPVEAEEIGLVTETASADAFEDRLAEVAGQLAEGPTKTLGRVSRLLEDAYSRQLPAHLDAESEAMVDIARTEDYREGVDAFNSDRDPEFQGR